jgi:hypothetical protein
MWAALAFGLIGLIIFVQYPAGGVPFLLLAAFLGWRARARIALGIAGLAHRAGPPDVSALHARAVGQLANLTPLRIIRFFLAMLAGFAAFQSLWVLSEVISSIIRHSAINWQYSGVGLLMSGALVWAALSLWRFRQALSATGIVRQLIDGALRLAAGSLGAFFGIWSLSWLPQTVANSGSFDTRIAGCFLFPVLAFLSAGALGFAHRDRLLKFEVSRPVLRTALYACASGAAISAVLIVAAVYVASRGHSLSVTALIWSANCGMVGFAAMSNARSAEASSRRFGAGYGGAFIAALGAMIPALWIEDFASGRSLIESWNILIVFMPFVLLGSVAVSVLMIVLGWRLYRKAF